MALIADPPLDVGNYACGTEATIISQNFHEILRRSFGVIRQILFFFAVSPFVGNYAYGQGDGKITQNFHEILRRSFDVIRQILALIADSPLDVGNYAYSQGDGKITQNFHEIALEALMLFNNGVLPQSDTP